MPGASFICQGVNLGSHAWVLSRVFFSFFPPTHPLNNSERDIQHIGNNLYIQEKPIIFENLTNYYKDNDLEYRESPKSRV